MAARCAWAASGCRRIDGERCLAWQQVPFTCWYSNSDNIVFPTSVASLPGADNRLAAGRGPRPDGLRCRDSGVEALALLDD